MLMVFWADIQNLVYLVLLFLLSIDILGQMCYNIATDKAWGNFMKVSFDLDDTLFVPPDKFRTEKPPCFPFDLIFKERLRLGTKELFHYLREKNIDIWIYTTSFRSESYIRGLFRCYGLTVDRVINGAVHEKEVQGERREAMPSKYPAKYRIDLHIDDDPSVAQNGKIYGFKVFLLGGQDDEWTEKIKERINHISP